MHVKKRALDSYFYMLLAYLILVANATWFVYGNVLYYSDPNKDIPTRYRNTVATILWLGYLTICKCFLYSCVVMIGIPFIFYMRRRSENYEAANDNLLGRLVVVKFDGLFDFTEECVICLHTYTDDAVLVRLPCNEKHMFHRECIR